MIGARRRERKGGETWKAVRAEPSGGRSRDEAGCWQRDRGGSEHDEGGAKQGGREEGEGGEGQASEGDDSRPRRGVFCQQKARREAEML